MNHRICSFTVIVLLTAVFLTVEVGAQDGARVWNDKSGKFQITAELLEHNDTAVKLRKADKRVVTVPLNALSDADRKYLEELAAEPSNPFAGGEVMEDDAAPAGTAQSFRLGSEVEELPTDGVPIYLNIDEPISAVAPDPIPAKIEFAPFARPLGELDAYARVSQPIVVDPRGPVFAVSTHRNGNAVSPANFGNVYLVSKNERRPQQALNLDETFLLFDHNIKFDRSLGVAGVESPSDRGGDLVLLDKLSTGRPEIIARWHLPEWQKPGFKPKVEFASMIDAARALVKVNDTVYVWSLNNGECSLMIDRVPATGKIAVSGGGRYLAVSVSGGTQLIDIEKAEMIGKIPFQGLLTPEVRFSPEGNRLGMAAGDQVAVWNLQNAGMEIAETIESTTGRLVGWVGNDHLLTQFGLIDLELARAVWKYHLPSGGKEITIPGGFVSVDKNARPVMLLSLPMPHGAIDQVKRKLQNVNSSMLLLEPGSEVKLTVDSIAGVDENVMRAALAEAVQRAGWKVSSHADVEVIASITRGEKQKLNFRSLGASIYRDTEVVTLKPYRASLRVVRGGNTLWQRSTQNMVPFIVRLKQGESLQKAVKKYEKADPEYFRRVSIPSQIFKPEHRRIVGTSRVKNGVWTDF